ncbi:MAG: C45 family peptidase [Rhizomicrobium sp.]
MLTSRLPVIELSGTPRERGRIHGAAMREHIRALIAAHEQFLREYFGADPDEYLGSFRAYGAFEQALARWTPDLLEEVRGIAEGADLPFETMLQYQLIDEEWAYGFYHRRPVVLRQKCSAFGMLPQDGQPGYAGQNMDVPRYIDGHQVLLRIADAQTGAASYVFTYAGLIGLAGMSDVPLGITCNTLNQLRASNDGLPVAFIVRHVLACRSPQEALGFLRTVPHASGQNYILSSRDSVHCLECSAGKVVEFFGNGAGRRVCHTNHALANDDEQDFQALMAALPPDEQVHFSNSRQRYASISTRLGDLRRFVDLAAVKTALSAHDDPENPVSRTYLDTHGSYIGFTAGSLIYDYGEPPRLHLASGPPCSTEYRTFDLKRAQ